ncbi:MAG: hypothetical protein U5S82_21420 [Gammaproteobacteria bacterium]|nr:hypothetical protein [Gammaproteobacteria bacterium]
MTEGASRCHVMPFGATVLAGGGVLFRLWAPAAGRVDLCLYATEDGGGAPDAILPMTAEPEG